MSRVTWIDSARGIGILLVILGHAGVPDWAKSFIYTFHIPLFFFLSGYLFNYVKYQWNISSIIAKKTRRLVYPYIFTFMILCLVWGLIKVVVGILKIPYHSPIFDLSLQDIVFSLVYGNGAAQSPAFELVTLMMDPPLWFLPALFLSVIVLFVALKVYSRYGPVLAILFSVVIVAIGMICGRYLFLPWGLDIACISLVFTGSGYLARTWQGKNSFQRFFYLFPLFFIVVLISYSINGYVDMNTREYKNILFFFAGGIAGSMSVGIISAYMERYDTISSYLSYFGIISLFIMVFHVPLMVFCIGPLQVISPALYSLIQGTWVLWFILSIGLCLGVWQIISGFPKIRSIYAES